MKNLILILLFAFFDFATAQAFCQEEIPNVSAREIAMMSAYENPEQVGKGYYVGSELKHKLNNSPVRKCAKKPVAKSK